MASKRETAFALYADAIEQIILHECAHHLLEHFQRIGKMGADGRTFTGADAEFEADLFAITNAVQMGDSELALTYFFFGLKQIEGQTRTMSVEGYESARCRDLNVDSIARVLGVLPSILFQISSQNFSSPPGRSFRTMTEDFLGRSGPILRPGSCGHLREGMLGQIREEARSLYGRIKPDLPILYAPERERGTQRLTALVSDLIEMSGRDHYLNGLAAGLASIVLLRRSLINDSAHLLPQNLSFDLNGVMGAVPSGHVGRLLMLKAQTILLDSGQISQVQERIRLAWPLLKDAVLYNPRLTEAWLELAFASLKRANCAEAVEFARNAVKTSTDTKEHVANARLFAIKMKQLSDHPDSCKAEASRFQSRALGER